MKQTLEERVNAILASYDEGKSDKIELTADDMFTIEKARYVLQKICNIQENKCEDCVFLDGGGDCELAIALNERKFNWLKSKLEVINGNE